MLFYWKLTLEKFNEVLIKAYFANWWGLRTIDVKNINLQIKNNKDMFSLLLKKL